MRFVKVGKEVCVKKELFLTRKKTILVLLHVPTLYVVSMSRHL